MWLLNFHLAVSILCLLTFLGFRAVFKEVIIQNGYTPSDKKKKSYWIFFIPIMNICTTAMFFIMITMKKEDLDKWVADHKKKGE